MVKKIVKKLFSRDIMQELIVRTNSLSAKEDANYRALNDKIDSTVGDSYLSTELLSLRKDNNKKNLLITGYYGAQNCGDELMLEALLKTIDMNKYNIYILVLPNNEIDLAYYAPYDVVHYSRKANDCLFMSKFFDAIVWGGGAVIDDVRYKFNNGDNDLTYVAMSITKAMIKQGKDAIILGVSTNQHLEDTKMIEDLKYIIDNAKYFSLRDKNSLKTLSDAGINTDKINIIDDLALSLDYSLPIEKPARDNIGLVLLINGENKEYLADFIKKLRKQYNKSTIRLIPFLNYHNCETKLYTDIINQLKDPKIVIDDINFNATGVAKAFSRCDVIMSMRYHATLIAGYVLGKKVLSINYSSVHRHYVNKIKYIRSKYVKKLVEIDYTDINNVTILEEKLDELKKSKNIPASNTEITKIRDNLKQIIKDNL